MKRMYKHLNWANQRILEALQQLEHDNREARRLFSHILYSEQVWLSRLQGKDSSQLPIWGEVEIEVCEEMVKKNEESFAAFLADLDKTDLDQFISYKNSKGEEFNTSIRDVLTHVALHGQHHRGQINAQLRANHVEPVNTDFITFVR
ncbi:DinB family protein [Pueribacillus theae]